MSHNRRLNNLQTVSLHAMDVVSFIVVQILARKCSQNLCLQEWSLIGTYAQRYRTSYCSPDSVHPSCLAFIRFALSLETAGDIGDYCNKGESYHVHGVIL